MQAGEEDKAGRRKGYVANGRWPTMRMMIIVLLRAELGQTTCDAGGRQGGGMRGRSKFDGTILVAVHSAPVSRSTRFVTRTRTIPFKSIITRCLLAFALHCFAVELPNFRPQLRLPMPMQFVGSFSEGHAVTQKSSDDRCPLTNKGAVAYTLFRSIEFVVNRGRRIVR